MGLLDDVAEAVTRRGQDIMDLIRSGKADEVTREMLDMGDPVMNARLNEYLWNNYDLPMDKASRMERARGFQGGLYSGTGEDFPAFRGQSWATDNPDLAYTYAPSEGGNIMPLMMRAAHGAPVINAEGANWNRLRPSMREGGPQAPYIPHILTRPEDIAQYGEDLLTTNNFANAAREQGFSGVTFNDMVDVGGYLSKYAPEGPLRDAQRASVAKAGEPSKIETRFYPNQVRSAFARFDPRLRHLDNLNAGVAGATAAGAGLLGYGDEANASPVDAIKGPTKEAALRLFRGTSGSAERIKGGIGEGLLFGTPDEDIARLYGDNITQFELPEGAKILTEGTPEFAAVTGRKRGPLLRTLRRGENLTSAANDAIDKAKAAGFDAVQFNSTRDMGVAVLNPKIVRPIGGVAGAGLLGYGDEANAMPAPETASGGPSEGDYSLGYRDTLGQLYQTDGGVMYPKGQSAEGLLATVDQPAPEAPQAPLSAFDEALRYYLGPTGIPDRIVAANELFNPVRGLERGMVASSQALNPNSGLTGWERVGKGMDATTETLGALLGFGGAKTAIEGAAPLIDDALKAGARFGAEESGAVNLGGLYNALGRVPDEALANATPFRRTGAENFAEPRRAAGRAKDPALYTEFSTLKQDQIAPYDWEVTGRKLAGMEEPSLSMRPEDIASRFDAIYGYPADATLNNVVIDSVNGVQLPFPILQQAGHTYIDNPQLGFASERTAMASRNKAWREAQREGMRVGVTPMVMGPKGGDFSQHLGQTQAQLILGAADKIDPNFMPNIEELRAAGLTGLLDPRLPYVIEHMKGSNRAKVVKALDTSPAMKAGVPSVAATRWATMDPNLVGADLLSSGYRFFEPLASDAIRRHGGELHATYTGAVNKVGPSMTMGDPRPWYLMFPDEALPRMEASTRKGANMPNPQAMPKDLRAFQMNTRLRQIPDQEWVDVNSKYDEILASKGKEAADTYAIDALLARATRKAK